MKRKLTPQQANVERLYQGAMNLRDSTPMGYCPNAEAMFDAVNRLYRAFARDRKKEAEAALKAAEEQTK